MIRLFYLSNNLPVDTPRPNGWVPDSTGQRDDDLQNMSIDEILAKIKGVSTALDQGDPDELTANVGFGGSLTDQTGPKNQLREKPRNENLHLRVQ